MNAKGDGLSGELVLTEETGAFLRGMARDVVAAARVAPGQTTGLWVNITGGPLFKPCASANYPAFWIRDFSMSLETMLFSAEEVRHALLLTASTQSGDDRLLPSGSLVPFGSIADHINFDGSPVFFPGTYNVMEQGGHWGVRPPFDNPFYFVHMAWWHIRQTGDSALLWHSIGGVPLVERLERAFGAVPSDPVTGMVFCAETDRGANFGFMDTVVQTGSLLFASLLRAQAALEMEELMAWAGDSAKAFSYRTAADRMVEQFDAVFGTESGLLRAATEIGSQPDVWGTAFAVHKGFLGMVGEKRACETLAKIGREDLAVWKGQVRHVPPRSDFSEAGPWERLVSPAPPGAYQNGAYWATPSGWVCDAISRAAPEQAREMAEALAAHVMEEDFRAQGDAGAPWECVHPRNDYRKEGAYMTSITCPLIAFRRMGWVSAE